MLKLNKNQQNKESIFKIIDRIVNECILSAKSDKAKKCLMRTVVAVENIGEGVAKLKEMVEDAYSLSGALSTVKHDRFSKCQDHLERARQELE